MPSTIKSSQNPGSTEIWVSEKSFGADEEAEARLLGRLMCVKFAQSASLI